MPALIDENRMVWNPVKAEGYAQSGETPWHKFGTPWQGLSTDYRGMMAQSGADFVTEQDQVFQKFNGEFVAIKNVTVVRRQSDGKVFGLPTERYTIYQNVDGVEALVRAFPDRALEFETMGVLEDGRTWALARMAEDMMIGGVDAIRPYFMIIMGHGGKDGIHLGDASTRIVCANTMTAALAETGRSRATIKHYSNVKERVDNAFKGLQIVSKYQFKLKEQLERLANIRAGEAEMSKIVDLITPLAAADASDTPQNKAQAERLALWKTWSNSITVDRSTAYGIYNATTEYLTHAKRIKGMSNDSKNSDWLQRRALYNAEGPGADIRSLVMRTLLSV